MPKFQPLGVGMTPCKTRLGKRLRILRLKRRLTQTEVARAARMPQSAYSQLEIGRKKRTSSERLRRLARALKCRTRSLAVLMSPRLQADPTTELCKFVARRLQALGLTKRELGRKLKRAGLSAQILHYPREYITSAGQVPAMARVLKCKPGRLQRFLRPADFRLKPSKSVLGNRVRARRAKLGLSQGGLARVLGVTKQSVSLLELGRTTLSRRPVFRLARLAKFLGLSFKQLSAMLPIPNPRIRRAKGSLGEAITWQRLALGLTQGQVARRVGISATTLCHIETGRVRPSASELKELLTAPG